MTDDGSDSILLPKNTFMSLEFDVRFKLIQELCISGIDVPDDWAFPEHLPETGAADENVAALMRRILDKENGSPERTALLKKIAVWTSESKLDAGTDIPDDSPIYPALINTVLSGDTDLARAFLTKVSCCRAMNKRGRGITDEIRKTISKINSGAFIPCEKIPVSFSLLEIALLAKKHDIADAMFDEFGFKPKSSERKSTRKDGRDYTFQTLSTLELVARHASPDKDGIKSIGIALSMTDSNTLSEICNLAALGEKSERYRAFKDKTVIESVIAMRPETIPTIRRLMKTGEIALKGLNADARASLETGVLKNTYPKTGGAKHRTAP